MKYIFPIFALFFPFLVHGQCDSVKWHDYVQEIISVDSSNTAKIDSLFIELSYFSVLNRLYLRNFSLEDKAAGFLKRNSCRRGGGIQLFDFYWPSKPPIGNGARLVKGVQCLSYAERLYLREPKTVIEAKQSVGEIVQHFTEGSPLPRSRDYYLRIIANIILSRDTVLYNDLIRPLLASSLVLNEYYELGTHYTCREIIFLQQEDCKSEEIQNLLAGNIYRKEFATRVVADAMIMVLNDCRYRFLMYEEEELPLSANDNSFNVLVTRFTPFGLATLNKYLSLNFGDRIGITNSVLEESTDYIIGR